MYELEVEGMSCGGCVKSVTKSMLAIDPDAKVEVDLSNKKVRVDSVAGLDVITSALDDAGFSVTSSTVS